MNRENLNNRIWYRALKVIFFTFLIIVLIMVNLITWPITENKYISDETFQKVGLIIKQIHPAYNDLSDLEVGKRVYERNHDNWEKYTTIDPSLEYIPPSGIIREVPPVGTTLDKETFEKYYKLPKALIGYTYNPIWQRITYNLFVSFIALLVCWLIARIFFYIVLGEKLFSSKRVKQ